MKNSNALTLFGWDDILCRPIYRRCDSLIPNPKSRKKKSVVKKAPSLPVFHPPTPDEFNRQQKRKFDYDIYYGEGGNNEEDGQDSKRRCKPGSRSSAIQGNTCKSNKSEMEESFSPRKHNLKTDDTDTNKEEISDQNTLIGEKDSEPAGLAAVECDLESNNPSSVTYECDLLSSSSQYNSLPGTIAERVNVSSSHSHDYTESSNADEKEVVSDQRKLSSTGSNKTQSIDLGSPSTDRIGIMSENQTCVHDHIDAVVGVVGVDVSEESCVSDGYYESVDDVTQPGEGRKDTVTQATDRFRNTASEESEDHLIGNDGKQYLLQSPMLLGCDRASEESSYADTIGTSLLGDMEKDQVSYPDNRLSYGQSNKPNWTSKTQTKHKIDHKVGQKQLVGWDDIKCRPIYQVSKPEPIIQTTEIHHVEEKPAAETMLSQKKRVYSSQYRMSRLFKAARHNMDFDSPTSRRVTLENEDLVVDQAKRNVKNADSSDLDTSIIDIDSSESVHREASDSDPYDDEIENRIQPTSNSSIVSAAAFFRYLDSNHHLNITNKDDGYGSNSNTKAGVIRTTREIRHSDQLRYEYDVYHSTVIALGLAPISVNEFARHWNLYFTGREIIRDGLLDEGD